MHSFIHPLSAAVPPCWESKSDWQIFRTIAKKFSELAAPHFPEPVKDLVALPLAHDSAAEIAQPRYRKTGSSGEVEAIPGKTMPGFEVVTRDYKNLYNQYISFGPLVPSERAGRSTARITGRRRLRRGPADLPTSRRGAARSIRRCSRTSSAATSILRFATVTNGELAYRSYKEHGSESRAAPGAPGGEEPRGTAELQGPASQHPHAILINSPMWSGLTENGRAYSPFTTTWSVWCRGAL